MDLHRPDRSLPRTIAITTPYTDSFNWITELFKPELKQAALEEQERHRLRFVGGLGNDLNYGEVYFFCRKERQENVH